jgi:UDP-glucose 4-epimerase
MKILVTGGAGFIGSHLVERLLQLGHQVYTLDDLSTGHFEFLESLKGNTSHTFVHGNVKDRNLVKQLLSKCDAVFHLAAVLGVKNTVENPLKVIEGNLDGTRGLLEVAHEQRKKVVFASTSEIYGKNRVLPFKEDESDRVLGDPSNHHWCYATVKALNEHLCFAYSKEGLPVSVVRYFNTYGPRQSSSQYGGVVPRFIKAALNDDPIEVYGNGLQTRSFTFIKDTVQGTIAALEPSANGYAFNIGSDKPVTIQELALMIKRLADSSSQIKYVPYEKVFGPGFEDIPARVPDLARSSSVLGFKHTVPLIEGLKHTIEWYRLDT